MTVEKRRALLTAPTYRADLDLVAVAPDGGFAAFCLVWRDAANGLGVFKPVGCRTAQRRQGLTKALLFEGMRRLRDLGAREAAVVSDPAEIGATSLYVSAGFVRLDTNRDWVKPPAPAP